MGFEQTVAEYRETKKELTGGSPEDQDFIRAMALQKAWTDRMCEHDPTLTNEEREALAVDTVNELGEWFRVQIMEFPADPDKVSRKRYYLDLFDQDPKQAVEELYNLFRSGLH